jgi:hypothetical protein
MEQPEAEIPASEKCGLGVVWELENENMVKFSQYCLCKSKILQTSDSEGEEITVYRVHSLLASFTKKL